jgi:acyl-CoA thioester hydrolase
MKIHTVEQFVRYAETDRMRVVHHSTYLLWFEVGRTGLLASAGFPYHELEAGGTLFPVIEFSCRFTGSADYGDNVRIDTHISSLRNRSVVFSYEVINKGTVIATGTTKHVAVDQNQKLKRLPDALCKALEDYVETRNESENH